MICTECQMPIGSEDPMFWYADGVYCRTCWHSEKVRLRRWRNWNHVLLDDRTPHREWATKTVRWLAVLVAVALLAVIAMAFTQGERDADGVLHVRKTEGQRPVDSGQGTKNQSPLGN